MPIFLTEESESVDMDDVVEIVPESDTLNMLYKQFSAQNLKLVRAQLQHNEHPKFMILKLHGRSYNVNVLSIATDGNCLFSALAHQLECHKIGSIEHKLATANLRKKVVEHIQNNIDQYAQTLKYRYSDGGDVQKSGSEFISTDLCKEGVWGGSETLVATTQLFEVNIVVFNENGPFYFAVPYQQNTVVLFSSHIGLLDKKIKTVRLFMIIMIP